MKIHPIMTGAFQEICYLVWNADQQALIFDPGEDADLICAEISRLGLQVAGYICTHAHTDHINALAALHEKHPAPIAMHSADAAWAFSEHNQLQPHYNVPAAPNTELIPLEKEPHHFPLAFNVLETPGHTPGSCCILFPESAILISGDTLFKGSCGRTDLSGGDPRALKESLNKLKQLPVETRVYPGHGLDTTIAAERATNFFMQ